MNILRLVLEIFLFYLVYKLIKTFLFPSEKQHRNTTKNARTHFKNNTKTEKQTRQTSSPSKVKTHTDNYGDYIDYEEIK